MKYKLTKQVWEDIGRQHQWLKEAQNNPNDPYQTWRDSLSNLQVITSREREKNDSVEHVERDPSSSWGGKEIYDGEAVTRTYYAILNGDIRLEPEVIENGDIKRTLKEALVQEIKEYGRDGVIPSIEDEINDLYHSDENTELENIDVNIQSLTPKESDLYNLVFALEYQVTGYFDKYDLKSKAEDEAAEQKMDIMRE